MGRASVIGIALKWGHEVKEGIMRRIWKRRARIHLLVAAAVVACLALVAASEAGAATITVNCTANPNALASALTSAHDGDTLAISGTCKGTFEIGHSLTLAGSGGATLDGQQAGTVLTVDAGRTVDISHLTITGGSSTSSTAGCGTSMESTAVGGINNFGTLTLTHSGVSGNSAGPSFFAIGGIDNESGGTLTLTQSTVSGNSGSVASGIAYGGIFNCDTMTITGSIVSGNHATANGLSGPRNARGGIENGGTMTITNSSVSQNTASAPSSASGGIVNTPTSTLTLSKSTVSGNSASADGGATGGIGNNGGQVSLSNSRVSGNSASSANGPALAVAAVGGISNKNSVFPSTPATGNVEITNSKVSENSASAPPGTAVGGISNQSPATITLTKSQVVNNIPINCDFSDPACALP